MNEHYKPGAEAHDAAVSEAQNRERLLSTLLQAAVDYIIENPAFSAEELHHHLVTQHDIELDFETFSQGLPEFAASVAEWRASQGIPELVISSPPSQHDKLFRLEDGRIMVQTASGDTFTTYPLAPPPVDLRVTMAASSTSQKTGQPSVPPAQPLQQSGRPKQPTAKLPEALPGHVVDPAFTPLELHIAEIAFKRLEWHTAKNGIRVTTLVSWLIQADFNELAAVKLVERLVRRGLLIEAAGDSTIPIIKMTPLTGLGSLPALKEHVQLKMPEPTE